MLPASLQFIAKPAVGRLAPLSLAVCLAVVAGSAGAASPQDTARDLNRWPQLKSAVPVDTKLEQRLESILAAMTLEQKIAQMIQPEIRDITVEDMRKYGFGSYLNGGGSFPDNNKHATPADWIKLADAMYQASIDASQDGSTIPTMWGTDAVHGHNNVIGATIFPHNIGLGAARDAKLIEQIARATAIEVRATGIDWIFAPTVAVPQDDRWGRTYEGYAEEPTLVRDYAAAIVRGLQGQPGRDFMTDHHVISTVKHFLGDGGTEGGIDQGDTIATEQQLINIHAQGYIGGLQAGAQTVMASFNSWHGEKNHGSQYLLTQVLKQRFGFDGVVVGDWNGHGQIQGCSNENCAQAANAGLDIYMVPTAAWKPLYNNLLAQVKSGEIKQSRIDDAVRRILRVKLRAGLFDRPGPAKRSLSGKTALIGASEHRLVARDAVRKSLVLLKNNQSLLPLSPKAKILLAGPAADDIGLQSGGWTISWQGTGNVNSEFPGGSSIYQGFASQIKAAGGSIELAKDGKFKQKPDVAVVVFGEEPYAEGNGDIDNFEFQRGNKTALALLKSLKQQGIPVVSVFLSGRPLWVNPELNQSDAFVAAWLPGSEGAGIADVLLKTADGKIQYDFHGKLSFSWPQHPTQFKLNQGDGQTALLPYGFGLSYQHKDLGPLSKPLSEQAAGGNGADAPLPLFDRAAKAPWGFWLKSGTAQAPVTANVQKLGDLSYKSIDRRVQEDGRELQFGGKADNAVALASNFPRDLRGYLESHAALELQINPLQAAQSLQLGIGCGEQCAGSVDITPLLQGKTGWQTLSIDLACFKGVDFGKVQQSFVLSSQAANRVQISDIRLVPAAAVKANLSCQ